MSEQTGPQQQGCSLVNMIGCIVVPAGIYFGIQMGLRYGGWGAVAGAALGAIGAVISIPLIGVALMIIAHTLILLNVLLERLKPKR